MRQPAAPPILVRPSCAIPDRRAPRSAPAPRVLRSERMFGSPGRSRHGTDRETSIMHGFPGETGNSGNAHDSVRPGSGAGLADSPRVSHCRPTSWEQGDLGKNPTQSRVLVYRLALEHDAGTERLLPDRFDRWRRVGRVAGSPAESHGLAQVALYSALSSGLMLEVAVTCQAAWTSGFKCAVR